MRSTRSSSSTASGSRSATPAWSPTRPPTWSSASTSTGYKHVLGIWLQAGEGAKFWLNVFTELRNRGLKDALIVCCDGLTGLPDAITTIWPEAMVQTCVVHLLRASLRYVAYDHRKKVAGALKPIYAAPSRRRRRGGLRRVQDRLRDQAARA